MELTLVEFLIVALLMLVVAALYSSVGHGGASGYLAVLSFFLVSPSLMSTTALVLNVLVAGIGMVQFLRAGHFSFRLAWPFVLLSIPAAFLGGYIRISETIYFLLLAGVLLFAAYRLAAATMGKTAEERAVQPSFPVALGAGAGIGFLSGIVGVGGGIFLSPIMILVRWASMKQTAAISAFFIVVNSLGGLVGRFARGGLEVGAIWPFVAAAFVGGLAGSYAGSRVLTAVVLRRILAAVLFVAAFKLVLTAMR
ncbi:MAG: sulfite exporter TauE/SafE family protein [Ignavibacteriales bacterium]|nr:sulfite exporter TauE/SafE family protein [Ignavibacteriales bacterium]